MSPTFKEALPVDLFHLLSTELSDREDFPTLFNFAVSSKLLANSGAIAALYRISHRAPVKGGPSEGLTLAEQGLVVQKWSILWRSIALSALGKTLFPYCRYIRSLDLLDLGYLLDDDKFRGKVSKHFFTDELANFHFFQDVPVGKRRIVRLDAKKIIAAIGNEITKSAALLESISEPTDSDVLSTVLPQWAPRLTKLRSLALWDGKVFADDTIRNLLHSHCPNLSTLRIYNSSNPNSDHYLALFISGMPEHSLVHFENLGNCGIGTETCIALSNHGRSLRTLKLALTPDGVLALALLRGCTSLERLALEAFMGSVDLKATQNDTYLGIIDWLKDCNAIEEISFNNLISAPDLSLPVLTNHENALRTLEITGRDSNAYVAKDNHDFHQALSMRTDLEQLVLNADPDSMTGDDIDILVNAFCSLKKLRTLKLTRISECFSDEQIHLLSQALHDLEELLIGGDGITDSIWPSLAKLKRLKTVTLNGITTFTFAGISAFMDQLGEGNVGFNMSVDAADPEYLISNEDQDQLRSAIAERVNGRFEYQPSRDPNMPEFDSEDSD